MNSRLRGSERICSAENHQAFLAYTLFGISVYPDISQAAGRQALWTGNSHNAPLMVSSPSIEKLCTFFCPAFHELENDSGNSEWEHVGLSWVQILTSGQIWVLSEGMTELASVPFDLPNSTFIFFMQKKKNPTGNGATNAERKSNTGSPHLGKFSICFHSPTSAP